MAEHEVFYVGRWYRDGTRKCFLLWHNDVETFKRQLSRDFEAVNVNELEIIGPFDWPEDRGD